MDCVVILFGSEVAGCDLNFCPSQVFGPFSNGQEADQFMEQLEQLSGGWRPHRLFLEPPESCPGFSKER